MDRTLNGGPPAGVLDGSEEWAAIKSGVDVTISGASVNSIPRAMSTISGLLDALAATVKTSGSQSITGIKNFATGILVPDESLPITAVDGLDYALSAQSTLVAAPGGIDDTANVNAAKTAAGSGGTVVFGPGTYVVSGLAASVANQHWIVPPHTTIKTKNSANTPTIDVTANGVTIDGGGTLDGNRTNQTSTDIGHSGLGTTACVRVISRSNVTVENLTMVDGGSNGVFIDASTNVTIKGNRVSGCAPTANSKQIMVIDVVGSSAGITIKDNVVDAASRTNGCIVALAQAAGRSISRLRITDNTCLVGNAGASDTLGIELFSDTDASIFDATIRGNLVIGPSGVVSTDKVFGVSCGGNSNSPIEGDTNITITGNVVRNCPALCFEAVGSGIAITGNAVSNSGPIAVLALTTTGDVRAVSVTGNTLIDMIDPSYCFRIHGGTDGIYGLVVSGNTVRNNAGGYVMLIDGVVSGASITGNTFTDCNGPGIGIVGTLTDSVIANNVIDLTGVGGSTADGILLASTTVARLGINGNTIKGAARHGIYGNAACSDVSIVGNRITTCTDSGLFGNAAMTRWTVVGNTISHNTNRGLIFFVASTDLAIASNTIHNNPSGDYYTTGSTFLTHIINGAGG